VGRTDNVPRRIDEWKKREPFAKPNQVYRCLTAVKPRLCFSSTYSTGCVSACSYRWSRPVDASWSDARGSGYGRSVYRKKTLSSGQEARAWVSGAQPLAYGLRLWNMKTEIGLIHIELAARSATSASEGVCSRKYACPDCQTMHQVRRRSVQCFGLHSSDGHVYRRYSRSRESLSTRTSRTREVGNTSKLSSWL
jgi:hypothetical protein